MNAPARAPMPEVADGATGSTGTTGTSGTSGTSGAMRLPAGGRFVRVDDVAPQAWRNGGGRTRELRVGPAVGADWAWRLSVADIDADGPFSAFPGVDRWFVVLEGAGVDLSWGDRMQRVRPGDAPLRFDGGDPPGCRLTDGPTRDLNLMLRGASGRVQPCALDGFVPDAPSVGLFAWTGGTLHVDAGTCVVPPRSLCWWERAPVALTFEPHDRTACAAWWIAVAPAPAAPMTMPPNR